MKFKEWLKNEMMGSVGSIVSCKDLNNPNFQIQGSLSNLGCRKHRKKKHKKRRLLENSELKLSDFADIKTKFEDADFWIVRRGSIKEVGKPTKEYNPEHIGIKVTSNQLLPDYLFYAIMHLHSIGYFGRLANGTTNLVNIKTSDITNIRLG